MRIDFKGLKKLKVVTKSGTLLGRVTNCTFDTESQTVIQYKVHGPLLSTKYFLVSRDQVYSIDEKKMVVYDTVIKRGLERSTKIPIIKEDLDAAASLSKKL